MAQGRYWRCWNGLLNTAGVCVHSNDGGYGGSVPILSATAPASWLDQSLDLTVAIYHEQFEDDPDSGALPVGRFPLKVYPETSGKLPSSGDATEWFPGGYLHFSVDFQWYSRSGVSLLRLERIFVRFD